MVAATFDYHAPSSLGEALSLLNDNTDDAKVLAGGHSLIPMMKLRLAEPRRHHRPRQSRGTQLHP